MSTPPVAVPKPRARAAAIEPKRVAPITPPPSSDLDARVTNRKQELIAEILEHKKNSSRAGAAEAIDRIKARLLELASIVKEGPKARGRLDEWVSR